MHHVAIGDASLKCPEFYDIITFKGGDFVKENKLAELSMEFAVDIINLVRQLKENREAIISNQIGRSVTSIGANIHESQYAQCRMGCYSNREKQRCKRAGKGVVWNGTVTRGGTRETTRREIQCRDTMARDGAHSAARQLLGRDAPHTRRERHCHSGSSQQRIVRCRVLWRALGSLRHTAPPVALHKLHNCQYRKQAQLYIGAPLPYAF